ncbi:MAG: alcohol dehydrogenase class IV [Paraglaciecola psychrophila]|jgi:alcohol dehydrogenase class IV
MNFSFSSPLTLTVAAGSALNLATSCNTLAIRRPLVVTDPGLMSIGLVQPLVAAIEAAGLAPVIFDQVREDPPEAVIEQALAMGLAEQVDGVIAIGGGSSMDVAKVVAVLLKGQQTLSELYGVDQVSSSRVPLICVPTTAGTGSEATPVAVITTGETTKAGISSAQLIPDVAILDPDLTLGLPAAVTAMTGIDAMVHAIEAYTSKFKKNPMSDSFAQQALRLLSAALPKVLHDPADRAARADMLLGAHLAGQAFANAPVAAVHALAYPLGGHYHIPHGLSNSLVLPSVIAFNMPVAQAHYAELAPFVTEAAMPVSDPDRAQLFLDSLQALISSSQLPTSLAAAQIPETDLPMLAAEAMAQQRLLINNPRAVTEADALAIYQAAYRG